MENIVPSWPGIHRDNAGITFTKHDISLDLPRETELASWISTTIDQEGYDLDRVDFIFCSDEFLHQINVSYLDHDEYTDIITFPLEDNPIVGEIYISIDRVRENSTSFGTSFENELHRVIIHGVLHLCGYDDHEDEDAEDIRRKEEIYLMQLG